MHVEFFHTAFSASTVYHYTEKVNQKFKMKTATTVLFKGQVILYSHTACITSQNKTQN